MRKHVRRSRRPTAAAYHQMMSGRRLHHLYILNISKHGWKPSFYDEGTRLDWMLGTGSLWEEDDTLTSEPQRQCGILARDSAGEAHVWTLLGCKPCHVRCWPPTCCNARVYKESHRRSR